MQDPMKSLHPCPGSQCTQGRVCVLQERSCCFPILWHSPPDYKAKCSGGLFLLMPDAHAGEPDVGLGPMGELVQYNCSPVCGSPTWGVWGLIILCVCPSYHLLGFLHAFGCINRVSFLVGLHLFYWWWFSIQLWLWWASTLPSCPPLYKYFYVYCISVNSFFFFETQHLTQEVMSHGNLKF